MAGLAAVLAAVAAVVVLTAPGSSGGAAPRLPARALVGRPASLASLRGRPALVDFFASWCGPCRAEAPVLERVARRLAGRGHVVAVDWSDGARYARRFVSRYRWTFPVLSDPNGTAGYAYGVQGLPVACVLDRSGRIVKRLLGPQSAVTFVRAVESAGE